MIHYWQAMSLQNWRVYSNHVVRLLMKCGTDIDEKSGSISAKTCHVQDESVNFSHIKSGFEISN